MSAILEEEEEEEVEGEEEEVTLECAEECGFTFPPVLAVDVDNAE